MIQDSQLHPTAKYHFQIKSLLFNFLQKQYSTLFLVAIFLGMATLSGCERQPPDERAPVILPVSQLGNAENGRQLYHDLCDKCHKLTPGVNGKGPQLLRIYGAPAGALADYKYSDEIKNSGWVWDEQTLDKYIADAQEALPGNRMRTDGVTDATERADIITYLSTIRGGSDGE
ncbi:c-type cytochrome [Psychrobacter sp. I-STPA6b]|uniref:c-type cytochrome n=1 Tax=Psychrobacter sp. I-STPA6b TaxID=2585718 RepID=UPI001D0C20A9|nr:c-type cytochrome [Psychrobacter sp. I-STPA6b]